ncbi:hypothetical protein VTJ83DRAFT_2055 [Remersonia thermophila]|uniref:Zinc finger PHD-type domain-containing protein n=1 Tax=Remersonia thermophila TaxID=72144 RepID=A0ABR4DJ55_9PEZI
MPSVRKRSFREHSPDNGDAPAQPSILQRIRNMWQFANLYQFIILFGKALKIDDNLDIEDLEAECLKPGSMLLQDIGLGFLKFLSSHRGLTHELFDEYTRRQFLAKAPNKNPFGTEETAARFADFDVFTKIRVLQQMTQLIMLNPEKLRERTDEQRDTDQTGWRIEPYGWDRHDRTYFVLDDNRLYRLTEAPPAPAKPKKNTQKFKAAQRASKRRRTASAVASDADEANDEAEVGAPAEPEDDGLGGMKWECIAVTLDEVRAFLSTVEKTKDPNEKVLRDQIQEHLVPILEKQEESRKRKQLQRERELLSLAKMANAKRSSRLAMKQERQKMEELAREEERKRREEEEARRKEEQRQLKMERERQQRLMLRERRLQEREARRRLHEEELAQLSEDSNRARSASARMSERRRLAEIERNKKALQELEQEDDDWIFDCMCGAYGQVDDGTHSVACERCNIWQHSKCLGIDEQEADKDDFHFICTACSQRENSTTGSSPRVIKIKVNRQAATPALPDNPAAEEAAATPQPPEGQALVVELHSRPSSGSQNDPQARQPEVQGQAQPKVEEIPADNNNALEPARVQQSSTAPDSKPPSSPRSGVSTTGRQPIPQAARDPQSHDGENTRSAAKPAAPSIFLSRSAESGSGGSSPSKPPRDPFQPPTKTILPVPVLTGDRSPLKPQENIIARTPSQPLQGLPHLAPVSSQSDHAAMILSSPPLPPPSAGLSPTKHSPPPMTRPQQQVIGNGTTAAASPLANGAQGVPVAVFPPAAALSPSPRQQILTPPVKSAEQPVRAAPPQQQPLSGQGVQTPVLAPPSSPTTALRS